MADYYYLNGANEAEQAREVNCLSRRKKFIHGKIFDGDMGKNTQYGMDVCPAD